MLDPGYPMARSNQSKNRDTADFVVIPNESEHLSLDAHVGDMVCRLDLRATFVNTTDKNETMDDWIPVMVGSITYGDMISALIEGIGNIQEPTVKNVLQGATDDLIAEVAELSTMLESCSDMCTSTADKMIVEDMTRKFIVFMHCRQS